MEQDRTEMHDVSDENPDLVRQMSEMWLVWAKEVGAVPRPER